MIRLFKIKEMMDFISKMVLYDISAMSTLFGIKMVILVNDIFAWYLFEMNKYKFISMSLQAHVF